MKAEGVPTPNVEVGNRRTFPTTVRGALGVVVPIPTLPAKLEVCVTLKFPATVRVEAGVVVPMPTLPLEAMVRFRRRSSPGRQVYIPAAIVVQDADIATIAIKSQIPGMDGLVSGIIRTRLE